MGASGPKCPALRGRTDLTATVGKALRVHGVVYIRLLDGGAASSVLPFGSTFAAGSNDHTVVAEVEPLHLQVFPETPGAAIC